MAVSWKLVTQAPKRVVQAALLAHDEIDEWDADVVVSGHEIAEDRPDDWLLEAWLPRRSSRDAAPPPRASRTMVASPDCVP